MLEVFGTGSLARRIRLSTVPSTASLAWPGRYFLLPGLSSKGFAHDRNHFPSKQDIPATLVSSNVVDDEPESGHQRDGTPETSWTSKLPDSLDDAA